MNQRAATASKHPNSSPRERGSVFVEAVVIVPAFIFLVFAAAQLFIISFRLSQAQLLASTLARTLAVPGANGYPCAAVQNAANQFGAQIGATNANALTIQVMQPNGNGWALGPAVNCPAVGAFTDLQLQTAVLTLNYQAPLAFGQIIPGGFIFNYRAVAVTVLERPTS